VVSSTSGPWFALAVYEDSVSFIVTTVQKNGVLFPMMGLEERRLRFCDFAGIATQIFVVLRTDAFLNR